MVGDLFSLLGLNCVFVWALWLQMLPNLCWAWTSWLQISLAWSQTTCMSTTSNYLVNSLGAKTRLQPRGLQLYLPAFPHESGLSILRGSSFQHSCESLLDDKGRTLATSGGACETSFQQENLRPQQDKNKAALGTTALPKGARKRRRNKKKKPLAEEASPEQLSARSLEQEGQTLAASELRNSRRTSFKEQIELAAREQPSLEAMAIQEISLRILLTLSLRKRWLITTARATCSQEALGMQLRSLGLDQNKVDNNIFSGDELVLLLHENSILIAGTEEQQECFFCELSALECLDDMQKLQEETPIQFAQRILEYTAWSNKIRVALPQTFYHDLLQRHELQDDKGTTTLEEEEEELRQRCIRARPSFRCNMAKSFTRRVLENWFGQLLLFAQIWALRCTCSPKAWVNQQKHDEQQLRKVLGYVRETLHYSMSLQLTKELTKEEGTKLRTCCFLRYSLDIRKQFHQHNLHRICGEQSLTTSCKTTCARTHKKKQSLMLWDWLWT